MLNHMKLLLLLFVKKGLLNVFLEWFKLMYKPLVLGFKSWPVPG